MCLSPRGFQAPAKEDFHEEQCNASPGPRTSFPATSTHGSVSKQSGLHPLLSHPGRSRQRAERSAAAAQPQLSGIPARQTAGRTAALQLSSLALEVRLNRLAHAAISALAPGAVPHPPLWLLQPSSAWVPRYSRRPRLQERIPPVISSLNTTNLRVLERTTGISDFSRSEILNFRAPGRRKSFLPFYFCVLMRLTTG